MTPQTASERLRVALGERAYDIIVGPRLIKRGGARDPALDAPPSGGGRHRRDCRPALFGAVARQPRRRRDHASHRCPAAGRRDQRSRSFRPPRRGDPGVRHRARYDAGGVGRRRCRRRDRICRGDVIARDRFRTDPDDLVSPGRQFGRRQDRDQHPDGQELDRRLLPAAPGSRRHRGVVDPAAARTACRLRRDRQIRPDPRC